MKFNPKEDEAGTYVLDVTGYVCPHPQLYALKCMEKLREGQILEILVDNPSSTTQPKAGVTQLRIQK